jgi:non-ribosomal peptide synthase protein (TIGR01720 family)
MTTGDLIKQIEANNRGGGLPGSAMGAGMAPALQLPNQGIIEGIIPLSPMQQLFFHTPFEQRHHYNQAALLNSKTAISETHLRAVLNKMVLHHDALRMVYRSTAEGWVQENKGADQGYGFEVLAKESDDRFIEHCERIQGSFDLGSGPLFKVALFRGSQGDQLLLLIHHLVVDDISWRILFEDLSTLYQQATTGQPLSLPLKTDSFRDWQQRQIAYTGSQSLQQEAAYWQTIEDGGMQPLPTDDNEGANTMADAASSSFMLDETMTDKLLSHCCKAYQTDVNDILITALCLAMAEMFGMEKLLIRLEGHGRENISGSDNIGRTVGWFTTMYPLVLDLQHRLAMVQQLIAVKETLRRVPNKGIGYGMLRYLAQRPYRLKPQVSFNYLGYLGSGVKTAGGQLFAFSGDYHGQVTSPLMPRSVLLEVNGMIVSGKVCLSITYSHRQYQATTIEKLLLAYQRHLTALIEKLSTEEMAIQPSGISPTR